ncbi:hypothetical protein GGF37_007498, partial [Kickxella alabastrina]
MTECTLMLPSAPPMPPLSSSSSLGSSAQPDTLSLMSCNSEANVGGRSSSGTYETSMSGGGTSIMESPVAPLSGALSGPMVAPLGSFLAGQETLDAAALRLSLRLSSDASCFGQFGLAAFAVQQQQQDKGMDVVNEEKEGEEVGAAPGKHGLLPSKGAPPSPLAVATAKAAATAAATADVASAAKTSVANASVVKEEDDDPVQSRLRSLRSRRASKDMDTSTGR